MSEIETRAQAQEYLADKARRDVRFRRELMANPKAVISRELGVSFAANVNVQVLEETPSNVYLVLPSFAVEDEALADAELDAVTGGATAKELQQEAENQHDVADTAWNKIRV